MTVKEADDANLLIVGSRVKTNGSMTGIIESTFTGIITDLTDTWFKINIDKNSQELPGWVDWTIHRKNSHATIIFFDDQVKDVEVLLFITKTVIRCRIDGNEYFMKLRSSKYLLNNVYKINCYILEGVYREC